MTKEQAKVKAPWTTKANFLLFSFVLGAIVGLLVWAFLFVMTFFLNLIWIDLPAAVGWKYLPIVICAIGGVVIGVYERICGEYPESMDEVMAEVKRDGGYEYGHARLAKGAIGALLPLVFGGSLGPEAGLTGMIAGMCTWVGDRMKTAKAEARDMAIMGMSATLGALFNAPVFGFVAPLEDSDGTITLTKSQKIVCYVLSITGGMLTMMLLKNVFGGGMSIPRFEAFQVSASDIPWAVLFVAAGFAMGCLYYAADKLSLRFSNLFGTHKIVRATVCGIVLGALGVALPYVMFAGESQAEQVIETWTTMAAWVLLATGLLKACITPFCIRNGWRGGNIFPLIFSGICVGFGLASLTGTSPGFAVCLVVASFCGAVMRKPIGVIALLLLCFPTSELLYMVLGAIIGAKIPLPKPLRPQEAQEDSKAVETGSAN